MISWFTDCWVRSGKLSPNVSWLYMSYGAWRAGGLPRWRWWIFNCIGPDSSSYFWFHILGLQINFARPQEEEDSK